MGGPIVRTGTTPEFWANWDNIFGDKKKKPKSGTAKASAKAARKAPKKSAKKKSGKK
ncbi:MAG: RNA polymerase subunit sigma [Planctomycetaceae bacterium]